MSGGIARPQRSPRSSMAKARLLMPGVSLFIAILVLGTHALLPQPFSRVLRISKPLLNGSDVIILQNLLQRAGTCSAPSTGAYDAATARAVSCAQHHWGINGTKDGGYGVLGNTTAWELMSQLSHDGWQDDGRSASDIGGYKYKFLIPVHSNRSRETVATLLDAHNNVLLHFPARTHGYDVDATGQRIAGVAWPDLTDNGCPSPRAKQGCIGLNQFSGCGATPTGLVEVDLNAPEDDPASYGPYPVNRFVRGLEGNSKFLVPGIRNGILLHTGQWANFSTWRPGQPMPNSAGCVHSYLPSIKAIWRLLVDECGVHVRPNTNGKRPYPYKPQGVAAVFNID